MTRNRLYLTLLILLLAGYSWLIFSIYHTYSVYSESVELCIFKVITGVPCPSCGSTRSVVSFFKGDVYEAIMYNPIGIILAVLIVFTPFWLLYDIIFKRDSLLNFYNKFEIFITGKKIMIIAITLVIANWIWNIFKEFS